MLTNTQKLIILRNNYSSFEDELQDLEHSEMFSRWLFETSEEVKEICEHQEGDYDLLRQEEEYLLGIQLLITHTGLYGFCEKVAAYFTMKYEDVSYEFRHSCRPHAYIKYHDKYYDSSTREGVSHPKLLNYYQKDKLAYIGWVSQYTTDNIDSTFRQAWDIVNHG